MYTAPNGNTCHLIALEGADRVGKQTQSKLLEEALNSKGFRATVEEIPYNDGVTHPEIYRMLKDGSVNRATEAFQTLQGVNRRFFQHSYLPNLAGHFDVVVLDRWNLSTRVYGAASGVSEDTTGIILHGIVDPDLVIVLDGKPFPKAGLDVWEADTEFQRTVREGYRNWCERDPQRYVKIDANGTKMQVHEQILERVLGRLR
jgi:dTMP kinase